MTSVAQLKVVPKRHVSVKELAEIYGMSKSTIYELIKTDATFPYRNIGLKKRIVIDVADFESWLCQRMQREKEKMFHLPSAEDLVRRK